MVCVLDFKRDVGLWHGILCVSNHSFSWKDNSVVFSGFVRVLSHLFLLFFLHISINLLLSYMFYTWNNVQAFISERVSLKPERESIFKT